MSSDSNKSPEFKVNAGQILLSEPFMTDPNFKRSAVVLCEHTEEGSLGFVLNKKIDMQINDLMADFPEFDCPIYFGGPVATDTIHFMHNVGDLLEGSQRVSEGVWWGGEFEKLKFLVTSELIKPDNIRFFVGYSGWSGGQLKEELETGSWVIADLDANYIFKAPPNELWERIMKDKGDRYAVISQVPDNANWN